MLSRLISSAPAFFFCSVLLWDIPKRAAPPLECLLRRTAAVTSPEEEKVRCPDADKEAAAVKVILVPQVARCSCRSLSYRSLVIPFSDVLGVCVLLRLSSSMLRLCAPLSRCGSMSVVTWSLKSTRPVLFYFSLYRITPEIRHDLLEVARLLYTKLRHLRTF